MCDTLVTITDAGVLFAKNSDRDPNEAQIMEFHPAGAGETQLTHTAIEPAPSYAVLISRPWWMWGAEIGANEHGVTIGNEAVFTRGVGKRDGTLLGMDLLRLALERAANRHEAVQTIVSLLEAHGQGGSCSYEHPSFTYDNSYLIADREGAVVLETAGRHWATEEVRHSRSISNGLTIAGFAQKYADPLRGRVAQCAARRSRTEASAKAATNDLDLMAALRNHGGDQPAYSLANGAISAPCAHPGGLLTSTQSTASWVGNASTGKHWVTATSAPCTSIFKPLEVAPLPVSEPVDITNRFDERSLWWRHERAHRRWVANPAEYDDARAQRDQLERDWVNGESDQAWEQASLWEESLATATLVDQRPALVRRLWAKWDKQAGVWA